VDGGGTRPRAGLEGSVGIGDCAVYVLGVGGIDPARAGFASYLTEQGVLTYVQMCKPVAGFVTASLERGRE